MGVRASTDLTGGSGKATRYLPVVADEPLLKAGKRKH